MVFNPAWNKKIAKRRRTPPPGSGVKHSDIMKRRGVGSAAPIGKDIKTPHGFRKEVTSCDKFTQYYECLYSGNSTSFGFSNKGFKTFRVERGVVFVTVAEVVVEGKGKTTEYKVGPKEIKKIQEGGYISLNPRLGYSIATSGHNNAELIVTETAKYQDDWKALEAPVSNLEESALRYDPAETPDTVAQRVPRTKSKAYEQAQNARSRQQRHQTTKGKPTAARLNSNSSTVVGDNVRPISESELLSD